MAYGSYAKVLADYNLSSSAVTPDLFKINPYTYTSVGQVVASSPTP